MFQILVVEDDQDLNRTVCAFLNSRSSPGMKHTI